MESDTHAWRIVRSEEGPDYGIFQVRQTVAVSPRTGAEGRYVVLDSPDFVNVIAITGDAHVVLVRQHRHGINEMSLEIPAGLVDGEEAPLAAAQRELAEETGYTGERWHLLGRSRPNAAFMNNWCYHLLLEDARLTGQPHLDPGEAIAVELAPLDRIADLIAAGMITQALVISAFYWFEHRALLDRKPSTTELPRRRS
jgi:8-oxo-dGTP pyrophosphatase MutT (NUDIX family)